MLGTGTAICWVIEPHWLESLATDKHRIVNTDPDHLEGSRLSW
jgi:hypothetical protein